jgi:hypothetical protein
VRVVTDWNKKPERHRRSLRSGDGAGRWSGEGGTSRRTKLSKRLLLPELGDPSRKTRVESSSGSSGAIFPPRSSSAANAARKRWWRRSPRCTSKGYRLERSKPLARSFVGIVLARARSVDSTRSWTRRLGRFAHRELGCEYPYLISMRARKSCARTE